MFKYSEINLKILVMIGARKAKCIFIQKRVEKLDSCGFVRYGARHNSDKFR